MILHDYKIIQEEMLSLREKVIMQSSLPPEPIIEIETIEQVWKDKIDRLCEEREILL